MYNAYDGAVSMIAYPVACKWNARTAHVEQPQTHSYCDVQVEVDRCFRCVSKGCIIRSKKQTKNTFTLAKTTINKDCFESITPHLSKRDSSAALVSSSECLCSDDRDGIFIVKSSGNDSEL